MSHDRSEHTANRALAEQRAASNRDITTLIHLALNSPEDIAENAELELAIDESEINAGYDPYNSAREQYFNYVD